ncbi:MAG TPA: RHS repeat-associated core domain-containing protein [Thermoanaerobaculia bacterium]|nr:RHS repeat-associated core domain-containing protein [Thermoanaerobaculia bacterium]
MIKRTIWAIVVLVASAALAQERYSVTLRFDADDDPEVVTRQLAATYRLQIESAEPDSSTIVVRANHSAVPLLRVDRRVVAVEAARPAAVATNARGFGAYAYDGAGNITQAGDDSFLYDTRGRIEKATTSGIAQTFTYDRWGNITNIATTGEPDDAIGAGTDNRLAGATYDGSGNLLSYHGGTFIYDALNVVKESRPTGSNNRYLYLYTASNERIATIEVFPTGQRRSDWTIRDDTGKVLRRFHQNPSGTWSWTEDYIYRGSQLLAAEVPSSEKVRHFHLDHLGTPRLITGNGGAVIAERTYSAFGRALDVDSTPPPDERAQFTGHERDSFQLDYMHARYYDPMVGRFLSVDPGGVDPRRPQSWNRYSYVLNNPVNLTDPTGRCVWDICIGEGALLWAAGAALAATTTAYLSRESASHPGRTNAEVMASSISKALSTAGAAIGSLISLSERPSKTFDDLWAISRPGPPKTPGPSTIRDVDGGYDDAVGLFGDLIVPGSDVDKGGGVIVGQLPDGRTIVVRPKSSDGAPTIEIQDGKTRIKFRFREKEEKKPEPDKEETQ